MASPPLPLLWASVGTPSPLGVCTTVSGVPSGPRAPWSIERVITRDMGLVTAGWFRGGEELCPLQGGVIVTGALAPLPRDAIPAGTQMSPPLGGIGWRRLLRAATGARRGGVSPALRGGMARGVLGRHLGGVAGTSL